MMELTLTEDGQLLRVDSATELELEQLNISLTRRIENHRFNPLVKKGVWDGYISYFKDNMWIPSGLWQEVTKICKQYNFDIKINGVTRLFDKDITAESFEQWALEFFEGHPDGITPRDYQIEAAFNILKFRRSLSELATSAGKTLISFLTVAYMLEKEKASKILFIVPNVSLVVQATEDFAEYNHENRVKMMIQQIYSGQKIKANRNIVVGTYQSLLRSLKSSLMSSMQLLLMRLIKQSQTQLRQSYKLNPIYKLINFLNKKKIYPSLVSAHTIKPLDKLMLKKIAIIYFFLTCLKK